MAEIDSITEATSAASHPAAVAYAELLAEIEAVPEAELIPIKIDVIGAVTTVLGALPEIRALREEIADNLKRFDFERFDKLERYARALHHAHVLWRASSLPKAEVTRLAAELSEVRDRLLKTAETLAAFGLIDGERLKEAKKLPGYRPLAIDVATLVEVIRERWALVQNKTPLTLADLDRAAGQALDLLAGIGLKEQAPAVTGEAALTRQRVFTLFERGYDQARRAVLYLRPQEADQIAPSIYAGRGGRGASSEQPMSERAVGAPGSGGEDAEDEPPVRINNPTGLPATSPLTS
jgi:hypothetical protein